MQLGKIPFTGKHVPQQAHLAFGCSVPLKVVPRLFSLLRFKGGHSPYKGEVIFGPRDGQLSFFWFSANRITIEVLIVKTSFFF